jgi:hypothetical protein
VACGSGGACPGGTTCNTTSGFCEGPGGGAILSPDPGTTSDLKKVSPPPS